MKYVEIRLLVTPLFFFFSPQLKPSPYLYEMRLGMPAGYTTFVPFTWNVLGFRVHFPAVAWNAFRSFSSIFPPFAWDALGRLFAGLETSGAPGVHTIFPHSFCVSVALFHFIHLAHTFIIIVVQSRTFLLYLGTREVRARAVSDLFSRFQRGLSVPFLTRFQRVWNLS